MRKSKTCKALIICAFVLGLAGCGGGGGNSTEGAASTPDPGSVSVVGSASMKPVLALKRFIEDLQVKGRWKHCFSKCAKIVLN